ncbi:MAG: thiamine pyrophosphate-dependent enzyme [Dehalococcoidia bacterium]
MTTAKDGGEAILEAFRNLDIDYIISSPGSEWSPVWEALARQKVNETPGPTYINCWHETLAVNMATGYTRITGKMQAVLLHAGVGLLQGGVGIHGALQGEVPMLVCSGEADSYGENPELDPQGQWYRNLSVVGGPNRFVEPFVKWSGQATSPYTLYEQLVRAGEMAQRVPKGPTYLDIPIETMIHDWAVPEKIRQVPTAPKTNPSPESISLLVDLISRSNNPLIITDVAGAEPLGFAHLVNLCELMAIPVAESAPTCSNFPKSHPLYLGNGGPYLNQADLVLVIGSRAPWYPPANGPKNATVVAMDAAPLKGYMVYQNLLADHYVEGDLTSGLGLLVEALQASGAGNASKIPERRQRWEAEHNKIQEANRAAVERVKSQQPIDPVWLCAAISEVMPDNTIFAEETTSHRGTILRHVGWEGPHAYLHPNGGLGQGLGLALGAKLARPQQPVVALMGDGGLLYNPVTQSFGVAGEANLPFMTIVFNNANYEAMRRNHQHYYPGGVSDTSDIWYGVHIPGPDYRKLVDPFGGYGVRVADPAELKPALENALAAINEGKIALVDVVLSI